VHTGAELANVLNEAALETVRRGGDLVNKADIYNGMDRILQVPLLIACALPIPFRTMLVCIVRQLCLGELILDS